LQARGAMSGNMDGSDTRTNLLTWWPSILIISHRRET
jgi:hypothetical protein